MKKIAIVAIALTLVGCAVNFSTSTRCTVVPPDFKVRCAPGGYGDNGTVIFPARTLPAKLR